MLGDEGDLLSLGGGDQGKSITSNTASGEEQPFLRVSKSSGCAKVLALDPLPPHAWFLQILPLRPVSLPQIKKFNVPVMFPLCIIWSLAVQY